MSQPDQPSQDIEISEAEASTNTISSDQTSTKQVEDKRLTELNGDWILREKGYPFRTIDKLLCYMHRICGRKPHI